MSGNSDNKSIESLRLELDKLQSEFLECLSSQDFTRIGEVNDRISELEGMLSLHDGENEIPPAQATMSAHEFAETFKLTAAQKLIADLESARLADDGNCSEEPNQSDKAAVPSGDVGVDLSTSAPAATEASSMLNSQFSEVQSSAQVDKEVSEVLASEQVPEKAVSSGLAERLGLKADKSSQKARESMFKAAMRAKERRTEKDVVVKVADEKLEELLTMKQVVEHTTSFFDLFFNPNKFISKQLEKQKAPNVPKPSITSSEGKGKPAENQSFTAAPELNEANQQATELRQKLESFCFYEILSISQTASAEDVGKAFVEKVRNLRIRFQERKDLQEWQLDELLRALSRANEVLSDPTSRRKYDLSLLGLHEFCKYPVAQNSDKAGSEKQQKAEPAQRQLSIVELFAVAGLISKEEMEEAKTKGFLTSDKAFIEHALELELADFDEISTVIMAQSLINREKLSLSQFELAMKELKQNSIRFVDTLIAEGWLSAEDLPLSR